MRRHEKIEILGYCLFLIGFSLPFIVVRTQWGPLLHAPVIVDTLMMGVPLLLGVIFICYGIFMRVHYHALEKSGKLPQQEQQKGASRMTLITFFVLWTSFLTYFLLIQNNSSISVLVWIVFMCIGGIIGIVLR